MLESEESMLEIDEEMELEEEHGEEMEPKEEHEEMERELAGNELPKFVLVEFSQLTKLLQRCLKCGKLPQGKSKDKPRRITWKKYGKIDLLHHKRIKIFRNQHDSNNEVLMRKYRQNKMVNPRHDTGY